MEFIVWAVAGVVGAVAVMAVVNAVECCVDA